MYTYVEDDPTSILVKEMKVREARMILVALVRLGKGAPSYPLPAVADGEYPKPKTILRQIPIT